MLVLFFAVWVSGIVVISPPAQAQTQISSSGLEIKHRGVTLLAMSVPPAGTYDIDLLPAQAGIDKLTAALDLLYIKSQFSVKGLAELKKAGLVTIVYDANFPGRELAQVTIAAFFPDFFQKKGRLKEFIVVVGRFGIKWPKDKLAAIIVHELLGHGIQHLRGRFENDRKIDAECEANLYEEVSHQELGIDRTTPDMVAFRRAMQQNWCSDFRRYMIKFKPESMRYWGNGRPDIPPLLKVFGDYLQYQRKTGVSGKAVAAAKDQRMADFENFVAAAEKRRDPKEMLSIGQKYLQGVGTEKDLAKARVWFLRVAELDNGQAQYIMGIFNEHGVAGPRNAVEAYMWYSLAAARGVKKSGANLSALTKSMSSTQVTEARKRTAEWTVTTKN